jgi:hydrophobe/amphiphile efflux-3 (HAE3) family protein
MVLGLAGAGLALGLTPTAALDTFVSSSSSEYRATQQYYARFGEEPVEVLVKGNLQQLVLSSDIVRLLGLEGCLAGKVPASGLAAEGGVDGPCGQLARAQTVRTVFGPGTFLNEAVSQINEQLAAETKLAETEARQAERAVTSAALARGLSELEAQALGRKAAKLSKARFEEHLATLALEYGLTSRPAIGNANFVSAVVFDSSKRAGTPKPRFGYLFPSSDAALVSIRMRSGLTEEQRTRTIGLIRRAVAMSQWHLRHGEKYLVTGEPVILSDLTKSITSAIELLLVAVLLVMAVMLGLIFSGRPRLLPLAIAVLAVALTFGGLSLVGAPLTIASIAALPVLVGLAVDYAIQFLSRVGEEDEGDGDVVGVVGVVRRAAAAGALPIATAAGASGAAMLVLLFSPVPMVRGFGVLLAVGVAVALLCTLTVGAAVQALGRDRRTRSAGFVPDRAPTGLADRVGQGLRELSDRIADSWQAARALVLENSIGATFTTRVLGAALHRPGRVLGVGLALAVIGWGLDTQTQVETDVSKLVPQNLSSLANLEQLERASGVGGQVDVMVSGANLASPSTIEWMSSYERRVLGEFGYRAVRGCGPARLCPAFSLPDLFDRGGAGASGSQSDKRLTGQEVNGVLSAIPQYFSEAVITADRRVATLTFGIHLMGLQQQQQLIEGMRARLHPPPGVTARLVGFSVLSAESGSRVASPWRRLLTLLAGIVVVGLVLLAAFRGDRRRALVPLAPIALASGWSALVLFVVRVPLNPMSVTLGSLVVAISTEFSVLLSERHRQERRAGYDTMTALRRSYRRTGAAVTASGLTAIAGFGVLALSDIRMLRDFGFVTLIDLSVSLVGVLVALPAAVVLSERGQTTFYESSLQRP